MTKEERLRRTKIESLKILFKKGRIKMKNKIIASILLCSICTYTLPVFAYTKDETVYANVNSQGENYQTIVSTHLENKEELEVINDISDLLNIENTNGEETFTQEGNSLIWKADKKDIYYQGESQKELPIACNIKYELNGKVVKPEEILGKEGHVKVTIQYENKEEHIVNLNGKEEKMYTPFVVVAGTILQNDTNKNIEITNGKVINDGSKTVVMGIAMPGLQESLAMDKNDIEIPNNIEITMDTTDFELGNIITFVTPKVLEDDDLTFLDKLDEIYEKVDTLQTASGKIEEGSVTLAEGTNQLASGTQELTQGAGAAYKGAKKIKEEVSKATNQLTSNKSEALDSNTLATIANQAKQLAVLSAEQKAGIGNQAQAVAMQNIQSQKASIGKQAESEVAKLVSEEQLKQSLQGLNLDATQEAYVIQIMQGTAKKVANQTAQNVAEQVTSQVSNSTAQLVAQNTATQTAEKTAQEVAKQVANEVKTQAQNQVATQMNTLQEGLNQLTTGLNNLNDGANSLQNGASELNTGANTLAEGIKTFNEEGIQKICDYMNTNLKDKTDRLQKLKNLSKEYHNFTMLNGDNEGSVKFIMIMDAIKKQEVEDNKKEEAILNGESKKESTK